MLPGKLHLNACLKNFRTVYMFVKRLSLVTQGSLLPNRILSTLHKTQHSVSKIRVPALQNGTAGRASTKARTQPDPPEAPKPVQALRPPSFGVRQHAP
jgi:hypothetical protein